MFTVILANKADPIDPNQKAHKSVGRTFPNLEAAQENADKRNSMIPLNMVNSKEYRPVELSQRAKHELSKRGEGLTVGERNRRVKSVY
ncbi:hypothetical protein J4061_004473 [Salmonella enterica]|nr:hypothetical protein [Salmonella enterica]